MSLMRIQEAELSIPPLKRAWARQQTSHTSALPLDKWEALNLLVHFVQWCENSFLQLSVRTCWSISDANIVHGQAVEWLAKYKYLDMFIDDKLSFGHRTEDLQEEKRHHMFVLRKRSHYPVDISFITHLLLFAIHFSRLWIVKKNCLNYMIEICIKSSSTHKFLTYYCHIVHD